MLSIRTYFLTLTAAAVLCGIVTSLLPGSGSASTLVKLISGVLLTLTALKPLLGVNLDTVIRNWEWEQESVTASAELGENIARDAMGEHIKSQCEAYILDKAGELGLNIAAHISLSTEGIPQPVSVTLEGAASPYARTWLQSVITRDLGIAKEDQRWIG